jgi:HTH-type transcriptional regulator / antitoxin MqsA
MTKALQMEACPVCDSCEVTLQSHTGEIERHGVKRLVTNLRRYVCNECGTSFVDDDASRHNLVRVQLAFGEPTRFLIPEQIRTWRTALGLTQREAARLFGGGLNAFSKYENGDISPAESMDNLIWLCTRYSGLVLDLAERRNVALSSSTIANCTQLRQTYVAEEIREDSLELDGSDRFNRTTEHETYAQERNVSSSTQLGKQVPANDPSFSRYQEQA